MCGGTRIIVYRPIRTKGLSPRVRGNPNLERPFAEHRRSIPACAGEPAECPVESHQGWVYPRVCGGTDIMPNNEPFVHGLSRVCGGTYR